MNTRRSPLVGLAGALLLATPISVSYAQSGLPVPYDDSGHVDKTFFTRRDAVLTGFAVAGTLAIAPFDERIAHWAQSPTVQGGTTRRSAVDWLTHINETPLTIGALATYGVGRIGRMKTVADIGLHVTESLVITDVLSEAIRGPIGRSRPRVSANDAFIFNFMGGFTHFDERSFPSLHSSSAFATASSLFGEIQERNPGATWYAGPLLFGAALVPGFTRVYLNEHWASDIASGAFIGTLVGTKVVHYAHSHRRTKLDQFLLGTTVVPIGDNRFAVAWSLPQ
jgi:membrane-associated phospholipid phosphatase